MRLLVRSLAISVASVVLAATCAGPPGPTEAPASAAPRSAAPTTSPTATAAAITFPPDTYARILVDEIILHTEPGLTDEAEPLELVLIGGDDVLVVDAPTEVDGLDWYPVTPAADILGGGAYAVAGSRRSERMACQRSSPEPWTARHSRPPTWI